MWPFPDDGSFRPDRRESAGTESPDVRLTYQVAQRLLQNPQVRGRNLVVEVQNGVVLLSGTADSPAVAQEAASTARSTPGVRDVCTSVTTPADGSTSDGHQPTEGADRHEYNREFDEIARALSTEGPAIAGRLRRTSRPWPGVTVMLLAALAWALGSMLLIPLGWSGLIVACLICGAAAVAMQFRGSLRGRPAEPPAAGPPDPTR